MFQRGAVLARAPRAPALVADWGHRIDMASVEDHRPGAFDAPPSDLVDIVIRAGERGFPRWRVATALGLSASELAALERRISQTSRDGSPWSR